MARNDTVIAPERGEVFVDQRGVPLPRPMAWIERVNAVFNSVITSVLSRLDALEPQYVTKNNSDSPYTAADMDYITADMSTGDVTIVLPASGRIKITRDGAANTLTMQGTVNGVVNPTILFDGTTADIWHNGTEWRYG